MHGENMKTKMSHHKRFNNRRYLLPLIALIGVATIFIGSSYGSDHVDPQSVVWLEFKLPPSFERERDAIKLADRKAIAEAFKIYQEHRRKNEDKYRMEYELEYKDNPDFLQRNPYKYRDFETPEINYDAIAVNEFHGKDHYVSYAFAVSKIIREGKYAGQAVIRAYKKTSTASNDYSFLAEFQVDSDFGQMREDESFIIAGCLECDQYVSPHGNGIAVDVRENSTKAKSSNSKIIAIIKRQLKEEIKREKLDYKKRTNINYHEDLRIAGIYMDLNGDKRADIIASLNDPAYMYKYDDRNPMPTGSRFQLFCMGEKGCEHYLLLNSGNQHWEKIPLGFNNCIGISEPDKQGKREKIYTDSNIFTWDGTTYKSFPRKPNWLVK